MYLLKQKFTLFLVLSIHLLGHWIWELDSIGRVNFDDLRHWVKKITGENRTFLRTFISRLPLPLCIIFRGEQVERSCIIRKSEAKAEE